MARRRFSASNAAQLIACVGSADLENSIPGWLDPVVDDTVGAKAKGHVIHSLLEQVTQLPPRDMGHFASAITYVSNVRKLRRFNVLTETTRSADWLVTKPDTTVDVVLYVQDELHIIDWKTGKIPVSPVNNEQAMFYALTFADLAPKAKGAHLHIVQPWADGNMTSWFADTAALASFMQKARQAEAQILAGVPTRTPSDHCLFCPAYPHSRGDKGYPLCPEMMQLLYPQVVDEAEMLAEA